MEAHILGARESIPITCTGGRVPESNLFLVQAFRMALIQKPKGAIRISRHRFLLLLLLISNSQNRGKFLGGSVKIRRYEIEFGQICWQRVILFLIQN
ncbi:unnamed protein product [Citrullus colocynthis]|uniref:Uncharacterized protein n=1 Tax=Citrullus colocynthis TaxID=252529 RepID=A0ABP0Z9I4_9ROSI